MRVALIDGPLAPGVGGCVARLDPWGGARDDSPAGTHARAVAQVIRARAPGCGIVSIPLFQDRLAASAQALAEALALARDTGADIVHCSLGLARDDPAVAAAIAGLKGRIVTASAPARGGPVWPAALPGVVSVMGDARCGPGNWSHLALPGATWGACPRAEAPDVAGASIAAAHLTGILAQAAPADPTAAAAFLRDGAAFHGRERRGPG